jgi:hypothetical protein
LQTITSRSSVPEPVPDYTGSERGREYEDYVKKFINPPPATTPSGWVYALPNPEKNGEPVTYDDCKQTTGKFFEFKGPIYAKLLSYDWGQDSIGEEWLDQSARQIAAAGDHPIGWIFAEGEAADFARKLFVRAGGREKITIEVLPWLRSVQ